MVYHPRESEEGKAIKTAIESVMVRVMTPKQLGLQSKFLGHSPGIWDQIADIIAGEVRRLFGFNPDLLTHGSSLDLVTVGRPEGEGVAPEQVAWEMFESRKRVLIPASILKRALRPTGDCGFRLPAQFNSLRGSFHV